MQWLLNWSNRTRRTQSKTTREINFCPLSPYHVGSLLFNMNLLTLSATRFSFYKNILYKNIEDEKGQKLRIS